MSIATASFAKTGPAAVIHGVQTIAETRRQRLQMLIAEHGSLAALNERLERPRTDATLSQIKNRSPHHKTGKPRSMGDDLAREIEARLGKPEGWFDTPPTPAEQQGGTDAVARVQCMMLAMEPAMQYRVVRLVGALLEPADAGNDTAPTLPTPADRP